MHFDVATAPSFSLIPVESHLQGKQRRTPEAGESYWAGGGSLEEKCSPPTPTG